MSDLVRKEIHGIFGTKTPTEKQIRKYKRSEKELDKESNSCSKYVRSDFMLTNISNISKIFAKEKNFIPT